MRTRRYCYWLKGLDQIIGFRLEVNSEAHILFNDLLIRNKRKKKTITVSIQQVIKLAKEKMGKQRTQNTTFINMIKYEVGESGQKIFDRIFKLALERYAQLQAKGQRPILTSHRIPTEKVRPMPRPSPAPRPSPTPRPASQPTEPRQPTEKIRRSTYDIDKVKALIPQHLHKHLKFEYNPKTKMIIITVIKYIEYESLMKIGKISKRFQGTYVRYGGKDKPAYFLIPIEYLH